MSYVSKSCWWMWESEHYSNFIPPHSSHLLQPLDIGIFWIHKQAQSRIFLPRDLNVQSNQIIKIFSGFQSIVNPPNIISAFKSCGICSYVESGVLYGYLVFFLRVSQKFFQFFFVFLVAKKSWFSLIFFRMGYWSLVV